MSEPPDEEKDEDQDSRVSSQDSYEEGLIGEFSELLNENASLLQDLNMDELSSFANSSQSTGSTTTSTSGKDKDKINDSNQGVVDLEGCHSSRKRRLEEAWESATRQQQAPHGDPSFENQGFHHDMGKLVAHYCSEYMEDDGSFHDDEHLNPITIWENSGVSLTAEVAENQNINTPFFGSKRQHDEELFTRERMMAGNLEPSPPSLLGYIPVDAPHNNTMANFDGPSPKRNVHQRLDENRDKKMAANPHGIMEAPLGLGAPMTPDYQPQQGGGVDQGAFLGENNIASARTGGAPTMVAPMVMGYALIARVSRMEELMAQSTITQAALQEYDKLNGLPRSHSKTMVKSARSRKQLQSGMILPKWNGRPLLDIPGANGLMRRRRRRRKKNKQAFKNDSPDGDHPRLKRRHSFSGSANRVFHPKLRRNAHSWDTSTGARRKPAASS